MSKKIFSYIFWWPMAVIFTFSTSSLFANTDRYRVVWVDDPATQSTIGWNQVSGTNPVVYYDVVDHGTVIGDYSFSQSPNAIYNYKGMNNHFARLTGLQPNTVYYFVIADSEGTSQRFSFRTAPDDPSIPLSIITGGDSRNNTSVRINANKMVAKLRPHCVMFGGDMINFDNNSSWQDWLLHWQYTTGSDGRMTPIVPTRGNHESSNASIEKLFDTNADVYYAMNLGGNLVRAYTLNTNISISGNQTDWLEEDLASATACNTIWKIAQYHKPMRPHTSGKSEGNSMYTYWAPLFYKYNMNLVSDSDSHTCKTTWPIRPTTDSGSDEGFTTDMDNGTVYIGEGCWGAPLRTNDDNKSWTRNSGRFNQFKWLFIDQSKIEARTVRYDNVDFVSALDDATRFNMPNNIDIWYPSNGDVITINPTTLTVTTTSPVDMQFFNNLDPITITTAITNANPISKVDFYIDGTFIGSDNTAPYSIDWTPTTDGNYLISTSVTNSLGLTRESCVTEISINEALPVKLKSFNAYSLSLTEVQLKWETETEVNLDYFEVERAGSDGRFVGLTNIEGTGTANSGSTYEYFDRFPINGTAYYRLKILDADETITYSPVRTVIMDRTIDEITIYPNPTTPRSDVNLAFLSRSNAGVNLTLFDISGKLISQKQVPTQIGRNQTTIETSGYTPGIYFVKLQVDNKSFFRRLVVER